MPATKLAIRTQPFGAASGIAFDFQPWIEAVDAAGHPDGSYVGNVTAAIGAGTDVLGGTLVRPIASANATISSYVVGTYSTTLTMLAGEGALLPPTPYPAVWWNSTDYPNNPSLDPLVEHVWVTQAWPNGSDTILVSRGKDGTAVNDHNIGGKVYKLSCAVAKFTNVKLTGIAGGDTIVFSSGALTTVTSQALSPVTPQYATRKGFTYAAELPRATPSKTPIATFTTTYLCTQQTGGGVGVGLTDTITALRAIGNANNYKIRVADGLTISDLTIPPASAATTGILQIESQTLPCAAGTRCQPSNFTTQAIFQTTTPYPAILINPGTGNPGNVRLVGLHLRPLYPNPGRNDSIYGILRIGANDGFGSQASLAVSPQNVWVERCYIHGVPQDYCRSGIVDQGRNVAIFDNYVSEIHEVLSDTQAYTNQNGYGPTLIQNNYLEGATENLFWGGAGTDIYQLVPSDVTVINNHIAKPFGWQNYPGRPPNQWVSKHLLETKSVRRMLIAGNVFNNQWEGDQEGQAMLLNSLNQDGSTPWAGVLDVTVRDNLVRSTCIWCEVAADGSTFNPAIPTQRVSMYDNASADIAWRSSNGQARLVKWGGPMPDIQYRHNTAAISTVGNAAIAFNSQPPICLRPVVERNLFVCLTPPYSNFIADNSASSDLTSLNIAIPGRTTAKNVVMTTGIVADAPETTYLTTTAQIGFTTPNVIQLHDDVDPATVLAGLTLAGASPYKAGSAYEAAVIPATPTAPTLGAVVGGGTFAAGTYFYKVTAVSPAGESLASPEASVVVALNGSVTVSWGAVPTATCYRVYRGTASNQQTGSYVVTSGVTYTDTNTSASGTWCPGTPTANLSGTDGGDIGADIALIIAAIAGAWRPGEITVVLSTVRRRRRRR